MSADKIRRKDLKQQDDFLEGATRFTQWVMQRRRTIGITLLIVIAVVSVIVGVWNYRQRQEQNAAARLATALQIYQAPVTAAESPSAAASDDGHATPGHRHFETEEAKYEEAVEALRPVVDEYDGYPSGQMGAFYLGVSLSKLGRVEEAVEALERAVDAPAPVVRAMALYRLGQIHVREGRHEEAIAAFDRVLEESRSFPPAEAWTAKARAYEAAGDERAAMVAYQRVAEEHPGSGHAARARERAEEIASRLGVDLDAQS